MDSCNKISLTSEVEDCARNLNGFLVEPAIPRLSFHHLEETFMDIKVNISVLKFKDCFLLWIGSSSQMTNLAVALIADIDKKPTSTCLIEDPRSDFVSASIAKKLSRITKKQVFVSCNLPFDMNAVLALIEKRIIDEIKKFPDKF